MSTAPLASPDRGIVLAGVEKRYGSVVALRGVDLAVAPGQVHVLLGPNGAGKSTLVRILAAGLVPDAGAVTVGGVDALANPRHARARIGLVLADERSFFWRLNGLQNLAFFAALHGFGRKDALERARVALGRVGMTELAHRRVDRYSTGMKASLALARALLGDPAVLLLDEPTRSIDPIATAAVRDLVVGLARDDGVAVLFATHDLHEAAAVADAVSVLVDGTIATNIRGGADAAALETALLHAAGGTG
ncbi:MAG: ABC transporter ATP-binding protein [Actinomycetota bacterium]|nr:ABC transporter ATP-binding protein [Actinomycetota bacterium]